MALPLKSAEGRVSLEEEFRQKKERDEWIKLLKNDFSLFKGMGRISFRGPRSVPLLWKNKKITGLKAEAFGGLHCTKRMLLIQSRRLMAGRVCYAKIDQSKKKIVVFNANFAGTNGREPLSQPVPANGTTGTAWGRCRTEKPSWFKSSMYSL